MNILFATTEAVPFCKTGGLGDVCGSLPRALETLGVRPTLILPAFRQVFESDAQIEDTGKTLQIPIGQKTVSGRLLRTHLPQSDVPVFLIDQPEYYDRPQLYGEHGEDYQDNCERFVFFCRSVLDVVRQLSMPVDILHCHDWGSALLPAYLKTLYKDEPAFEGVTSFYTIHNLAYQGNFWHWDMALTGIDWKYFNWRQMEFYGNLNFMKAGISFADTVSTVSPTYSQEIMRPPLSCGLEGSLQQRREDTFGILNGVDYADWNPSTDVYLGEDIYDVNSFMSGKAACKAKLQEEVGLPQRAEVPLLAAVGRLADQKGFDLIARVMQQWAGQEDVQWVILGTGDPKYHTMLSDLAGTFPEKVAVHLGFSNELAHKIEAGADMFMMPSQYEPCGLNQLYSLKYGTIPVVRAVGGLSDTVVDTNPQTLSEGVATGFSFLDYSALALSETLKRACQLFEDKTTWHQLIKTGMEQDWSWGQSARKYIEIYEQTLAKARQEVLN